MRLSCGIAPDFWVFPTSFSTFFLLGGKYNSRDAFIYETAILGVRLGGKHRRRLAAIKCTAAGARLNGERKSRMHDVGSYYYKPKRYVIVSELGLEASGFWTMRFSFDNEPGHISIVVGNDDVAKMGLRESILFRVRQKLVLME